MTSKISFLKLMREDIKRKSWVPAFLAVLFFLAYPAAVMMTLDSMMETGNGVIYTEEEIHRWVRVFMRFGSELHFLLIAAAAGLLGMAEFSWMHSKEQLDLYYSLPIRRKRLFMSSYMTGLLTFLVIFAASQILSILVLLMKGMIAGMIPVIVKTMLFRILSFLFLYHLAIFAMEFTGKTVLAFMGMLILCAYGPALVLMFTTLADIGLYTMGTMEISWYINTTPLGILYSLGQNLESEFPYIAQLGLASAGTVGLFCLDIWMSDHRKTEYAGMALAFPKMEQILKFLLVLPASVAVGFLAYGMTGVGKNFWIFAGFLFGVVVFSILMEFIYHKDMKMVMHHKLGLGLTMGVGLVIISTFLFDWTGYNTWLPEKADIQAMSVYCGESLGGYSSVYEAEYGTETSKYKTVYDRLEETGTEDFDLIYELAREGISYGKCESESWTEMTVHFILKNGDEATRVYRMPWNTFSEKEEELYQQKWYQELCYPILSEEGAKKIESIQRVEISDSNGNYEEISGEAAKELLRVYREELAGMSYEELLDVEETDIIQFVEMYIYTNEENGKYCQISGYPLDSKFEKTLKLSGWEEACIKKAEAADTMDEIK